MGQTKHKQLMEAGGVSKLHLAVFQGKQEKVRKLLEKGCPDVNRGDKFGQTPLHIACHREGLLGCLKLLASHQADLGALDANGNTALHSAAGSGAAAAAEFLLGRGLSVADKNKDGHTPMDICNLHCPPDKQKSMQMMLEGGAKVEEDRAAGGDSTAAVYTPATAMSEDDYSSGGGGGGGGNDNKNNNTDSAARSVAPAFGAASKAAEVQAAAGHDAGAGVVAAGSPAPHSSSSAAGGPSAGDVSRGSFQGEPVKAAGAAGTAADSGDGIEGAVPATTTAGTTVLTRSSAPAAAAAAAAAGPPSVTTPTAEPKKSSRGTFLSALYRGSSGISISVGGTSFASTTVDDSPRSTSAVEPPRPAAAEPPRAAVAAGAAAAPASTVGGSNGRSDGGIEEYKVSTSAAPSAIVRASAETSAPGREEGAIVAAGGTAVGKPGDERRSARRKAALQELHLAIFQGDTAKVEEVVQRGDLAALNQADRHGQTPLHLACYKGSRVMTRLLVEGGADLNAVDVNGNGVVHAAVCDSPAVLAILIDHGADTTVSNYDGLTPKRLCEQYCPPRLKERMLQLLREGALARAKDIARQNQLAEDQTNIEAVYHQMAMLRSKLAATAAANTEVPASAAAEGAQTENALLTLVEANLRVVEGQRHALENMEKTTARLERMFRRLHMRMDSVAPGDISFS